MSKDTRNSVNKMFHTIQEHEGVLMTECHTEDCILRDDYRKLASACALLLEKEKRELLLEINKYTFETMNGPYRETHVKFREIELIFLKHGIKLEPPF